ncbi:hypothetical protein [Hydrogenophaga sp.]|uniref:hypothetical protein n=1 Tax=Hydrogenophaga sp. TaxID=1904254 RepID=UPI002726582C|nr:hypothetical protein [Hydrogenophaga sp.]MDO9434391.1 hypothetical protein [Hydrogenophaga sp.]
MATRKRADAPAPAPAPRTRPSARRAKPVDNGRGSFPGEHWMVLGAGLAAWALTRKHPSGVVRALGMAAGTALVGRAASGRDGLSKLLRFTPLGRRVR